MPIKLEMAAGDETNSSAAELENTGVHGRPCSNFAVSYCIFCSES